MRPWTLGWVAHSLGLDFPAGDYSQERVVGGISTDTRTLKPGDLFVPLVGEKFDGHDYAPKAIELGAEAIVWARDEVPTWLEDAGIRVFKVSDTTKAYQDLGLANRLACGTSCIAVTGSVGKTTTKEFLAHLLGGQMKVHKSEKNFNNDIGVPLTLLTLRPEHDVVIVEMGMRGPGQIARLVQAARPKVGVITGIGTSHLELLGTRENIARAKAELVAGLPKYGKAVLPIEDEFYLLLQELASAPVTSFGVLGGEVCPDEIGEFESEGTTFSMLGKSRRLLLPGRHHMLDLMASLAAGLAIGADLELMLSRLDTLGSVYGRASWCEINGARIYLDAYNAAPESMRASLGVISSCPGTKIAVLGDMLELGPLAVKAHSDLGRELADFGIDVALCYGPLSENIVRQAKAAGIEAYGFSDKKELALALRPLMSEGVNVLIKASRGMALESVLEYLEKASLT